MIPSHNYLLVSAIGTNKPDIISDFARSCAQYGCNLLNTKINVLGKEIAITVLLSGNWGAIAKMEANLSTIEERLGLVVQTRRTHEVDTHDKLMSYTLQVIAIDRNGILNEITDFLGKFSVLVEEVAAHTYCTSNGTEMASLNLKIHIPSSAHLATFREKFMGYCDDHNFDGFLEPLRSH